MPDLALDAPTFENLGSRLNQSWIVHWITDPKSLRHNATMPKPPIDQTKAADIAAYLATLTSPEKSPDPQSTDDLIAAGGRLFAHRHCIACHTLPDSEKVDVENGRTPLSYLKAKYKPAALFAFLKNPQQHYAWIRMPNFKFTDLEAQRLTAFLLSRPQKSLTDVKGDSTKGKQLVQNAGCLNCHTLPDKTTSLLKSSDLANLDRGCLSQAPTTSPNFYFTDQQRKSIAGFIKTARPSLLHESLPEFAQRQILHLRCTACHTRDNTDDLYPTSTMKSPRSSPTVWKMNPAARATSASPRTSPSRSSPGPARN
jgi:mono/diheme cytochrome c family protein